MANGYLLYTQNLLNEILHNTLLATNHLIYSVLTNYDNRYKNVE